MIECPGFAVVGHPNKGKSSIVATLAHQDSIAISKLSGTTVASASYAYCIDNKDLYTLFDTPGFQRPRQAFAWIESCAANASRRLDAVKAFLTEFSGGDKASARFRDEVELLTPIIEQQAGIIYVVDGSVPYSPEYETEMTILQWTGQPRMALINPIGGEQYIEQWQQALGQYFSLVRVFNPMTADMEKQLSILSAFSELHAPWQDTLQQAAVKIRQRQQQIKKQAAYLMAETLSDMLSHKKALPLLSDASRQALEVTLKTAYQATLKSREKNFQQKITELYSYQHLVFKGVELKPEYPDLFDQGHWYLFGLSRSKLVALTASAGAAAGAVLDAGVGGASLMSGALLGGLVSGATSLYLTQKPDNIVLKGIPLGGKQLTAGPVKNLQFAFVLLGRIVDYQRMVSARTHANRSTLVMEEGADSHWLEGLDKPRQIKLTRLLQKAAKGLSPKELRALQLLLLPLL